MPAIPESTRSSIILRLLDHAEKNWPQLTKVPARYGGPFAYITGVLPDGEPRPRRGVSARRGLSLALIAVGRHDEAAGTALEAVNSAWMICAQPPAW